MSNKSNQKGGKIPTLDANDDETAACYEFLAAGKQQITINQMIQNARALGQDLSQGDAVNMLEYALTHCPESMERGYLDKEGFKALMNHFKQPPTSK